MRYFFVKLTEAITQCQKVNMPHVNNIEIKYLISQQQRSSC